MKIAYVSYWDSRNVKFWSGTVYYMVKALREQGIAIANIDNLHSYKHDFYKIKSYMYKKILKKQYQRFREPKIVQDIGRKIADRLKDCDIDIILSSGSLEISQLNTKKPIIFWTDATFAGLLNFYPEYTNLSNATIKNGHELEQAALDRSSIIIFSSDWAARTAIENYEVNPKKIYVVPFGANIEDNRDEASIINLINNRENTTLKLLFVGVDWKKKGGGIIYNIVKELNSKGIKTILDIVGCQAEINEPLPDYINSHGFLNKNNPEELRKLEKLFSEAHFFVLPTQAEAYGLVYCEANSFGVPSIGSNIGGVPTIIKNGINGFLVEPEKAEEQIIEIILKYNNNFEEYKELALQSYNEYLMRLNWDVAGKKVKEIIELNL